MYVFGLIQVTTIALSSFTTISSDNVILPFVILQYIPGLIEEIKLWITIAWAGLLILDIVRIMLGISDDEREEKIEFLAERNAAWTMVLLIGLIILYQAMQSGFDPEFKVDWSLVVILFGGLIAKMISILVLKRKKL